MLNKLDETQLGTAIVCEKSKKQNAFCKLCGTSLCFVHYFNWKFETL